MILDSDSADRRDRQTRRAGSTAVKIATSDTTKNRWLDTELVDSTAIAMTLLGKQLSVHIRTLSLSLAI